MTTQFHFFRGVVVVVVVSVAVNVMCTIESTLCKKIKRLDWKQKQNKLKMLWILTCLNGSILRVKIEKRNTQKRKKKNTNPDCSKIISRCKGYAIYVLCTTAKYYLKQKEELIYFGSWPNGPNACSAVQICAFTLCFNIDQNGWIVGFLFTPRAQNAVQLIGFGTHTYTNAHEHNNTGNFIQIYSRFFVYLFFQSIEKTLLCTISFCVNLGSIDGRSKFKSSIETVCMSCQIGTHNLNEIKPSFLAFSPSIFDQSTAVNWNLLTNENVYSCMCAFFVLWIIWNMRDHYVCYLSREKK